MTILRPPYPSFAGGQVMTRGQFPSRIGALPADFLLQKM